MRKDRLGFRRLKKLINSDNDTKELIESYYFNIKAIDYANKIVDKSYMMNECYSLTTLDLLLMTDDAEDLTNVYNELMIDYDYEYAFSMWQNYLYCISKVVE